MNYKFNLELRTGLKIDIVGAVFKIYIYVVSGWHMSMPNNIWK